MIAERASDLIRNRPVLTSAPLPSARPAPEAIPLATAGRKKVDTESDLWYAVISATGQPQFWD